MGTVQYLVDVAPSPRGFLNSRAQLVAALGWVIALTSSVSGV
ncbi:hypothetical protein AB0G87_31935 [Streptomyces asoensis]